MCPFGRLAIPQGEYRLAIQVLQQAIAYFNEVRTPTNVGYCQIWIAMAFRLQGEYRQAEQLYRQTLEQMTAMKNPMFIAFCLNGLGCLAYDQAELPRAEQHQQEALEVWQEIGQEVGETATLGHLGQVLAASGEDRHAKARQYFRRGLELATKLQVAPMALDVCVGVAQLLTRAGDVEQATELLALAEQHEASTFETRQKARQHLAELEDQLSVETGQAAQTQGWSLDWQTAAQRLIEALAAQEEQ